MPPTKPPIEPDLPDVPEELERIDPPSRLMDRELEGCLLEGADLSLRNASGLQLSDARLVDVDLSGAVLTRVKIRFVEWRGGSVANARAEGSEVRRVRFDGARATGVGLSASRLEDVMFVRCRIDLANLRSARLARVRFESCQMHEADFADAELSSVMFEDCDLTRTGWSGVRFERCELRGCDLSDASGLERLRGVRMPWDDVIRSAGEIARAAGLEVVE